MSDIGNLLGDDWIPLAYELKLEDSDVNIIKTEYPENAGQQAMVMLRLWLSSQVGLKILSSKVCVVCRLASVD